MQTNTSLAILFHARSLAAYKLDSFPSFRLFLLNDCTLNGVLLMLVKYRGYGSIYSIHNGQYVSGTMKGYLYDGVFSLTGKDANNLKVLGRQPLSGRNGRPKEIIDNNTYTQFKASNYGGL
jgi:hypothetical protein